MILHHDAKRLKLKTCPLASYCFLSRIEREFASVLAHGLMNLAACPGFSAGSQTTRFSKIYIYFRKCRFETDVESE